MILESNIPIFNVNDYKGIEFTSDMNKGDAFIFNTYTNDKLKQPVEIKMIKTNNHHKSCMICPLIKFLCSGITCDCIAKRINYK